MVWLAWSRHNFSINTRMSIFSHSIVFEIKCMHWLFRSDFSLFHCSISYFLVRSAVLLNLPYLLTLIFNNLCSSKTVTSSSWKVKVQSCTFCYFSIILNAYSNYPSYFTSPLALWEPNTWLATSSELSASDCKAVNANLALRSRQCGHSFVIYFKMHSASVHVYFLADSNAYCKCCFKLRDFDTLSVCLSAINSRYKNS